MTLSVVLPKGGTVSEPKILILGDSSLAREILIEYLKGKTRTDSSFIIVGTVEKFITEIPEIPVPIKESHPAQSGGSKRELKKFPRTDNRFRAAPKNNRVLTKIIRPKQPCRTKDNR